MELLIINKTRGPNPAYQDGDVVLALDQERILWNNAKNIYRPDNFLPNSITGYYDDPLLASYLENISKYKYIRLNSNEVQRTNLDNSYETVLSTIPNYRGESIQVDDVINKKLRTPSHYIFGSCGKEVWYSDEIRAFNVDKIWSDIETHSQYRKSDNLTWPLTETEKYLFLSISCAHIHDGKIEQCSKNTASEKVQPIQENILINPITGETEFQVLKRRRWFVPYWDYDFIDTDVARDDSQFSDFRDLSINECVTQNVDEKCLCKIKVGIHVPSGA
jgi:hypothetical protein